MTIGEKITILRGRENLSQEALADKLSVSRQSVSKWEMDQAQPQLDKVVQLCELFQISADELLFEKVALPGVGRKGRYFGTDGFRGEANRSLTSLQAYKVGRFLGWYYTSHLYGKENNLSRPKIVIGKDTRRSSYMLEYSIAAGVAASGADAFMLHVTTTPSVSYITRQDEFDCGVMITASHNPFYDNGIKVINRHGEKLDDATTALIEAYLDGDMKALGIQGEDLPWAHREKIGCIVDYFAGRNRYMGYLISIASHSYRDLRIGLDCANGASWMIAKSVFNALGAQTTVIGAEPDGLNVNADCGSTHIEKLCALVKEKHLDVGFAFDGDADRCIAVDEQGNIVDGDRIMYILANRLKNRGTLNDNTVVATVMSNSGFVDALKQKGIACVQTQVGDRFVYEAMQGKNYSIGGEQSGHIILKKYATTGDGILTALMLTEEICAQKRPLSKLSEDLVLYPQLLVNLRVKDKAAAMEDPEVKQALAEAEEKLQGVGRLLLRQSGTEPLIRVMAETKTMELCQELCQLVSDKIRERGHVCE